MTPEPSFTPYAIGHVYLQKPRVCPSSWWIEADRIGFTQIAADRCGVVIPCDDVSDREVAYYQEKAKQRDFVLALRSRRSR
jgi:hypothetical protein